MSDDHKIDFEALVQEAMRGIVRKVLQRVAEEGALPGEHHFYIAFNTKAPGVQISPRLRQKYSDEMTIVMQHRFWGLRVTKDRFEIKLTFDSVPERLVVPFDAVKVFFDPSVPYGLQFEESELGSDTGRQALGMDEGRPVLKPVSVNGDAPEELQMSLASRGQGSAGNDTVKKSKTAGARISKKTARSAPAKTGGKSAKGAATNKPRRKKPAAVPSIAKADTSGFDVDEPIEEVGDSDSTKVVQLDAFRKKKA